MVLAGKSSFGSPAAGSHHRWIPRFLGGVEKSPVGTGPVWTRPPSSDGRAGGQGRWQHQHRAGRIAVGTVAAAVLAGGWHRLGCCRIAHCLQSSQLELVRSHSDTAAAAAVAVECSGLAHLGRLAVGR